MSSSVDWSRLPADLLQTIAGNLKTIPDYICFRSVCRYWRAAAELRCGPVSKEFPQLMLPLNQSSERLCFYNPLTNTRHGRPLPEAPASYRCIGSSFGRVILIDGSPDVIVLNPITGEKFHLPPLSSFPDVVRYDPLEKRYELKQSSYSYYRSLKYMRDTFFRKIVLTRDSQDPNKFSAFAISNVGFNYLAYCKHGDHSWSRVENHWGYYEDAISFGGKLYIVNELGSLSIYDFDERGKPSLSYVVAPVKERIYSEMIYLVYLMGELLLVERYITWSRRRGYHTEKFVVFRFDRIAQKWKHVRNLGDSVLFLGQNSSFALRASDYLRCKRNRIYFTDDYYGISCHENGKHTSGHGVGCKRNRIDFKDDHHGMSCHGNRRDTSGHDAGVYNLDDRMIKWIPSYDRKESLPAIKNSSGCSLAIDIWSLRCTVLEMATSQPPWSQYEGVAAMFKIGNSKELPNIPDHLSDEGKEFVKLCLQRNPMNRPTAAQLLDHHFVKGAAPFEKQILSSASSDHPAVVKFVGMVNAKVLQQTESERLAVHSSRLSKSNYHSSDCYTGRNISCPVSSVGSPLLYPRSPQHLNGRMSPSIPAA